MLGSNNEISREGLGQGDRWLRKGHWYYGKVLDAVAASPQMAHEVFDTCAMQGDGDVAGLMRQLNIKLFSSHPESTAIESSSVTLVSLAD